MTASSRDVRCYSKSGIQGFGFHQKNDNAALAVRFGSVADICSAKRHVRSTPKSGHWAAQAICPNSIIFRSLTAGVRSLRCSPFLIFIPSDEGCDDRRAD